MKNTKVAIVIPSMLNGPYWQPIFKYLNQSFDSFLVLSSLWNGFLPGYHDKFKIKIVEGIRFYKKEGNNNIGYYDSGVTFLPPSIIKELIKFKPRAIITSNFNIWTFFVLIYKIAFRKKAIIFYEGSSPSVDFRHSRIRTLIRKWMGSAVDCYLTNTNSGKVYLTDHLKIDEKKVFQYPIETPDQDFFFEMKTDRIDSNDKIKFIVSSQIIERKGIEKLILALSTVKEKGYTNFLVHIAGKGEKLSEYQKLVSELNLDDCIRFLGHLKYEDLKLRLAESDVYIFPSLEDTWGVAPLEALASGKPVLISKFVGSSELIRDYSNGIVFDPLHIEEFSEKIIWFIENQNRLANMNINALNTIESYNARSSAAFIKSLVEKLL